MQNKCCQKDNSSKRFQHMWKQHFSTQIFGQISSSPYLLFFFVPFFPHCGSMLLQLPRQEAGESYKGGASGERSQLGNGRLLILDSVLRHLPAGSSKTAQRWASVQDASCGWISPHHVWQTSQVCMMTQHWIHPQTFVVPFHYTSHTFLVLIFDLEDFCEMIYLSHIQQLLWWDFYTLQHHSAARPINLNLTS